MVLGKSIMNEYGLLLDFDVSRCKSLYNVILIFFHLLQKGLSNSYDPKIEASLPVSFVTAAFRFGHSLLPTKIEQWSISHKHVCKFCNWSAKKEKEIHFAFPTSSASKRLSELFNQPFDIYQGGIADMYMSGFMNQVSQAVDDAMTAEVRYL